MLILTLLSLTAQADDLGIAVPDLITNKDTLLAALPETAAMSGDYPYFVPDSKAQKGLDKLLKAKVKGTPEQAVLLANVEEHAKAAKLFAEAGMTDAATIQWVHFISKEKSWTSSKAVLARGQIASAGMTGELLSLYQRRIAAGEFEWDELGTLYATDLLVAGHADIANPLMSVLLSGDASASAIDSIAAAVYFDNRADDACQLELHNFNVHNHLGSSGYCPVETAIEPMQKYVALHQDDSAMMMTLADALSEAGKPADGCVHIERAIFLEKGDKFRLHSLDQRCDGWRDRDEDGVDVIADACPDKPAKTADGCPE